MAMGGVGGGARPQDGRGQGWLGVSKVERGLSRGRAGPRLRAWLGAVPGLRQGLSKGGAREARTGAKPNMVVGGVWAGLDPRVGGARARGVVRGGARVGAEPEQERGPSTC